MPTETQANQAPVPAPATNAIETQPGSAPTGNSQPDQPFFSMPMMLLVFLAIIYVVMIRPQRRREKELRQKIEALRTGSRVVFAGGLTGTIVEAKEKTFVVETYPGTKLEILRNAVQDTIADK